MNKVCGNWNLALKGLWLVLGGTVCVLWGAALVIRTMPPYPHLHDFVQEWTSARNYWVGQPIYLELSESVPRHLGQSYQDIVQVNGHPPASVLLALPLAALGYQEAYLVWTFASLMALLITLWWMFGRSGLGYSAWALLPTLTFLLISNSLAQQVNQGQLNLVLLLLITAAWLAMRKERLVVSGSLLGIATAIKLFPGFLLLYFVMQRQWRAVWAAGAAFAALNAVSVALFGWQSYLTYFQDVTPQVSQFRDSWLNASLTGFWSRLFDAPRGYVVPLWQNPALAKLATLLSCAVVTVPVAWRCRDVESQAERDCAWSLCIVAMLLVSPITWDHYFLLLILPFAIFWKWLPQGRFHRGLLLAMMLILVVINPKWIWDTTIPSDGEGLVASAALPWHALTLLAYPCYFLLGFVAYICLSPPLRRRRTIAEATWKSQNWIRATEPVVSSQQ